MTIRKAGALIILEKKLLIAKPYKKPFFINPGGKYERNETSKQCLERELKEELKISLTSCAHYKNYHIDIAAHANEALNLELYFVSCAGELTPSAEIEVIEWMSGEDFRNKKFNVAPSFYIYVPDLIKENYL